MGGNVSYAVYHSAGPYLTDVLLTAVPHIHIGRSMALDVRALYANTNGAANAMALGE